MKHKKKITSFIMLSLVVCMILLAPFSSFALSDEFGVPNFNFNNVNDGTLNGAKGTTLISGITDQPVWVNPLTASYARLYDESVCNDNIFINLLNDNMTTHATITVTSEVYNEFGSVDSRLTLTVNPVSGNVNLSHYYYNIDDGNSFTQTLYSNSAVNIPDLEFIHIELYANDNYEFGYYFRLGGVKHTGEHVILEKYFDLFATHEYAYSSRHDARVMSSRDEYILVSYSAMEDYFRIINYEEYLVNVIAAEEDFSNICENLGALAPSDYQKLLAQKWQEGFEDGKSDAENRYEGLLEIEYNTGYSNGYQNAILDTNSGELYEQGKVDGYEIGYSEGKDDGLDEGYRIGANAANSIPEAIDKIGLVITKSFAIFGGYGSLFGYSLLDIIVTIVSAFFAFYLARKAVQLL